MIAACIISAMGGATVATLVIAVITVGARR
jgi:hypothetical protein